MFTYRSSKLTIFFGDKAFSLLVAETHLQKETEIILQIKKQLDLDQVVFLRQTHGIEGLHIHQEDYQNYYFTIVGDYILTEKTGCGIGVVTADCLPIVVYDAKNHAVSIIHAGWKGLAAGVFQVALQAMQQKFHTQIEDLEIYLGPAARPCCYEVQQDLMDKFIEHKADFDIFFIKKEHKYYFDSRLFITVIARNLGIDAQKIYTRYNVCTICDLSYCSYRRQKEKAHRQISIVCLY